MPVRERASVFFSVCVVVAAALQGGCPTSECTVRQDCPLGSLCTSDGRCVAGDDAVVTWLSPAPQSEVPERFDAVLEVSFRGDSAELRIERSRDLPGDACAPAIPVQLVVPGDSRQTLTQQITIPGLRALGPEFSLLAVLEDGPDRGEAPIELRGPEVNGNGAVFLAPEEASVDAASAVTLPVEATFARAVTRASVWVEPIDRDGEPGAPSPRVLAATASTRLAAQVPLARGQQIVWVEADDGTAVRRCGRGILGLEAGAATPAARGLELGLGFEGDEAGLLNLRVRLAESEDGGECSFATPGDRCEPVFENFGPTTTGAEILRVRDPRVVEVAVVPGASGPAMSASVRVSLNGEHIGWLGPISIQPALGEVWRAGRILVDGGSATIQRIDDVVIGDPF